MRQKTDSMEHVVGSNSLLNHIFSSEAGFLSTTLRQGDPVANGMLVMFYRDVNVSIVFIEG